MVETKNCQNCKTDFVIDSADLDFYKKVSVPLPTFCWLCRAQRRMAFRNAQFLFKRKSAFSGKEIFSPFAPETSVQVYEKDIWLSDLWDPMTYGRDYDFSKPFFEQFKDFLHTVPLKNLNVVNGVNSDYVNNFTDPKNCYLVFMGKMAEDCMYGNGITFSKSCVDISHVSKGERCYECFWLTSCRNAIFSSQCESSYDIAFCKNCVGVSNCFGCVGLRKKSYCIFNEQYTKEEYEKKMQEFDLGNCQQLQAMRDRAKAFWLKFPNRYINGLQNTNVSGNYVDHSKNVRQSFLVREGEDLRYCQYLEELPGSKNCYDYTAWGDANELVYECTACGIGAHNIKFCYNVQENVRDIEYSYMCQSSSNLFGCIGLRKKQYCIFNKQYSKDEYEVLVKKIKAQMDEMPYVDVKGRVYKYGEFFPTEISPFAYNETLAQENFPQTKEEVLVSGFSWRDTAQRTYKITLPAAHLPNDIKDVPDTITSEIIGCAHQSTCNDQCTLAFRILADELTFYRTMKLPLPRLCPNCRHFSRISQRTKLEVYDRQCAKCQKAIETCYAPDQPEIVYCEACYQAEVA